MYMCCLNPQEIETLNTQQIMPKKYRYILTQASLEVHQDPKAFWNFKTKQLNESKTMSDQV